MVMRHVLIMLAGLSCQACFMIFPAETFEDMQRRLDQVAVPPDFLIVSESIGGSRTAIAAPPPPWVDREFSVRWEGGVLCDRLAAIAEAESWGRVRSTNPPSGCGYETLVAAELSSWFVNVWKYRLSIYASPPLERSVASEERCARTRERHERAASAGSYPRFGGSCWVPEGESLVRITVHNKQGWFGDP